MKNKLAEGAKGAEQAKAERTGNAASTEHHKANPGPVSLPSFVYARQRITEANTS